MPTPEEMRQSAHEGHAPPSGRPSRRPSIDETPPATRRRANSLDAHPSQLGTAGASSSPEQKREQAMKTMKSMVKKAAFRKDQHHAELALQRADRTLAKQSAAVARAHNPASIALGDHAHSWFSNKYIAERRDLRQMSAADRGEVDKKEAQFRETMGQRSYDSTHLVAKTAETTADAGGKAAQAATMAAAVDGGAATGPAGALASYASTGMHLGSGIAFEKARRQAVAETHNSENSESMKAVASADAEQFHIKTRHRAESVATSLLGAAFATPNVPNDVSGFHHEALPGGDFTGGTGPTGRAPTTAGGMRKSLAPEITKIAGAKAEKHIGNIVHGAVALAQGEALDMAAAEGIEGGPTVRKALDHVQGKKSTPTPAKDRAEIMAEYRKFAKKPENVHARRANAYNRHSAAAAETPPSLLKQRVNHMNAEHERRASTSSEGLLHKP